MVIPGAVGYLLLGVGLLLAAKWALAYLLTPEFFLPGMPEVVIAIAVAAALAALRLHRAR